MFWRQFGARVERFGIGPDRSCEYWDQLASGFAIAGKNRRTWRRKLIDMEDWQDSCWRAHEHIGANALRQDFLSAVVFLTSPLSRPSTCKNDYAD